MNQIQSLKLAAASVAANFSLRLRRLKPAATTGRRLKPAATILLLIAFIVALALPPAASAQVTPTSIGLLSSVPSNMALNTTSNITSSAITLRQGKGLALAFNLVAQGAGTSNTTFYADVSLDGTNYSTTQPLSFIVANNGTNPVVFWTNIPATTLDNSLYLRFTKIQCLQTNALTNISVLYGIKN